eukprot:1513827-Rhodomonas_salina.2
MSVPHIASRRRATICSARTDRTSPWGRYVTRRSASQRRCTIRSPSIGHSIGTAPRTLLRQSRASRDDSAPRTMPVPQNTAFTIHTAQSKQT